MNFLALSASEYEQLVKRLLLAEGLGVFEAIDGSSPMPFADLHVSPPNSEEIWIVRTIHAAYFPAPYVVREITRLVTACRFSGAAKALLILSCRVTSGAKWITSVRDLEIWDAKKLLELLQKHPEVLDSLPEATVGRTDSVAALDERVVHRDSTRQLLDRLAALPSGREHWEEYEDLCLEALVYGFDPGLRLHEIQSRSEDDLDVRDAVFAIEDDAGFWQTIQVQFRTRMVVAEFKNHRSPPGQKEVESLQQYLYPKAFRSVGILCSRQEPSQSALKARRRVWVESDKLILFLSDKNLRDVLLLRDADDDPASVLDAQVIEFLAKLCP